jgi:hypothetical protein
MGRHDMVWPVARLVEEVSVFARWTSEGAAPKDRPPLFSEGRIGSRAGRRLVVPPGDLRDVKGAPIPIVALTRGFPLALFGLVRNPETVPMMADGSQLRSRGETWGPVSPDNVHRQVSRPVE